MNVNTYVLFMRLFAAFQTIHIYLMRACEEPEKQEFFLDESQKLYDSIYAEITPNIYLPISESSSFK